MINSRASAKKIFWKKSCMFFSLKTLGYRNKIRFFVCSLRNRKTIFVCSFKRNCLHDICSYRQLTLYDGSRKHFYRTKSGKILNAVF